MSFLFFLSSCGPKVAGCTDLKAINFNENATKMKDSSCVMLKKERVTGKKPVVSISIDGNRFSNINYEFIYKSSNDTLKNLKKSFIGLNKYSYWEYTTHISDTVEIKIDNKGLSKHKVYVGDNIKVIETIGNNSKTYFLNIKDTYDKTTHLINPRGLNRYKTEQVTYSTIGRFNDVPNKIKRYRGLFYNKIDNHISYWFEDHPFSITVYESEYSLKKFYRTNIVRY